MSTTHPQPGEAFEELVRAVHRPVLGYLLRRTDPSTAADVLGDVLTVLWRRFDDVPRQVPAPDPASPSLHPHPSPSPQPHPSVIRQSGRPEVVPGDPRLAWCYGVARKCLANAERGARRRDRLVARIALLDPPAASVAADSVEPDPARVEELRAALGRLRPDDAEVLRLWAWEGLEPRDIALVLAVSANAASIRLHRAKARLGRLLDAGDNDAANKDPGNKDAGDKRKGVARPGHDQGERDVTEGGRR